MAMAESRPWTGGPSRPRRWGRPVRPPLRAEEGQASVELVAAVPALILAALISLQLLAAGYALTLADGAAEAGALALAEGGSAARAARGAPPGLAADNGSLAGAGDEVIVPLRPPSPFGAIADHLAVT